MKIYIDSDYKCHTASAAGRTAVETPFFDGKCRAFIEGYRFVPAGSEWMRADGAVFRGEMVTPWKNHEMLLELQRQYEETLAELQDMRSALGLLEVEPVEEVTDNG